MKCLVIGAGAIGAYVGGSLNQAGHPTAFLVRPGTAETLRAAGLRIDLKDRTLTFPAPTVYTDAASALAAGPEVIVIALKAYDTAPVLADLRAVTAAPPPILCLQNGVASEAEIAAVFGAERVIAGTVTTAVGRPGPGRVTVERLRGVGLALTHPLSDTLLTALNAAGLNALGYANAAAMKWSKLLTNLLGNAASAILDLTVAEIYADRRLFHLEMALLRETLAVMTALHIPVVDLPGTPVRALAASTRLPEPLAQPLVRRVVAGGRGGKMPSFYMDVRNGRGRTEAPWLHGAVARHARALGRPAPVAEGLTELVETLSRDPRRLAEFRRRPEALLKLINA